MKQSLKLVSVLFVLLFTATNAFAQDVYLYVTRHGKTMFNTVQRAQGWADTPLTPPGIEVAEQLGRGLKKENVEFVAVYSSDLGRARQTARIVVASKGDTQPVIEMEDFRETCFGTFEGDIDPVMWSAAGRHLGYKDDVEVMQALAKNEVGLDQIMDAFKAQDQSGMAEDYKTVKTRMQKALKTVAQQAQQQGGGNVLIVTHGMALLAMIKDMTDQPTNAPVKNASVTKIRYTDDGKFIVETIGDTSYIDLGKE
ncbi:histidine phosphatase family protein [Orbaceae bacterium ac157xtp]